MKLLWKLLVLQSFLGCLAAEPLSVADRDLRVMISSMIPRAPLVSEGKDAFTFYQIQYNIFGDVPVDVDAFRQKIRTQHD